MSDFPYETKIVKTPEFIINYPRVFKRELAMKFKDTDEDRLQFSCQAIVNKEDFGDWQKLEEEVKSWTKEIFGNVSVDNYFEARDCDAVNYNTGKKPNEKYPYLKNKYTYTLKNSRHLKIQVVGPQKQEVISNEDYEMLIDEDKEGVEVLYSGCKCRAVLEMYTFKGKKPGVTARLMVVQKLADGEPLGSEAAVSDSYLDSL